MTSAPPEKRNTSFKGDVLRLVSGTGLAQIIALLAAPILTRLYAPEAFGVAAMFGSITGILGVLACMRYELAIVLPDNDREAANLLAVSLGFSILITGLTIPLIWFSGRQILKWVNMPELASYLWLIPPMVMIHGFFTALNYWNTRTKHFTRLSIARVTSALTQTSGSLGAGLAEHATGGALIAAQVGGQTVATTVLGGQIWRDNGRFIISSVTWREMWAGAKRYKKFPLYANLSGLLNTASWQLPVLLLGVFFSPVVVGFYALGFRILQIPMSLIGRAIGQVFFQSAVNSRINGTLSTLVKEVFAHLVTVGLFPMLMLTFVAADLYTLVFGSAWKEAGVYTQILSIWAFFWFISSPLSTLFSVLERQEYALYVNVALLLTRFASISIGAVYDNIFLALYLFSLSGICIYGAMGIMLFRYSGINLIDIMIILSSALVQFLPFGVIVGTLIAYQVEPIIILSVAGFSYVIYLVLQWNSLMPCKNLLPYRKRATKL